MNEFLVVIEVSQELRYGKVVSNLLCPMTWQARDIDSVITNSDTKFFCHLGCIFHGYGLRLSGAEVNIWTGKKPEVSETSSSPGATSISGITRRSLTN